MNKVIKKTASYLIIATLIFTAFAGLQFVSTTEAQAASYPTGYPNTYKNTGNYANDIIGVAKTQVGYRENSVGTKYGYWYTPSFVGMPWCAMFVSWCANQAKVPQSTIKKYASCSTQVAWFKSIGRWHNSKYYGGNYTPKKGDVVFYRDGGSSAVSTHTGILVGLNGNYLDVIEGNATNESVTHYTTNAARSLREGGIAIGSYAHAAGDKAIAIGTGNIVTGDNSIAVGKGHTVSGKNSGAFGDPDNVYADASFAIGNDNTIGDKDDSTKGINTFVVGNNVTTTEEGTVVVGHHTAPVAEEGSEPQSSFSFGKNSISLGTDAVASVENTVALGSTSVAKREKENGGVGAGYDVRTGTNFADKGKDSATWVSTLGAVSVGGKDTDTDAAIGTAATATRQITGVAAGTADTDAVNVAQLRLAKVEVKGGTNVTSVDVDEKVTDHTAYTVNVDDLGYKVNNTAATPVAISKGINFVDGTGTTAELKSNGDVTFNTKPMTFGDEDGGTFRRYRHDGGTEV